ncbi:dTMP kinase [Herbidospora yilanensis]|uniref:dTMP kinase n=1 Tax=Herbidospora yilanensis TaxID=354426 RepID=UPI000785BB96|nr:dTMP kinase [Herbidospora yilanensis]
MSTPGRARKPSHVLAIAPFRRLWTAMSVGGLGDWLALITLTALAGTLTQGDGYPTQSLVIGGVFLAKLLPAVLLGPLAGLLVSKVDWRLAMAAADAVRFVVVLLALIIGGHQWLILAMFLIECASLVWGAGRDAAVSGLVPADRRADAERVGLLAWYAMAPLAAFLFALVAGLVNVITAIVPGFGLGAGKIMIVVAGICYLATAALVFTLDLRNAGGAPKPSVLTQLADGWRLATANRAVKRLYVGMIGVFAAVSVVVAVGRAYVGVLGGGDAGYATVFCAVFVGAAVGSFFGLRWLKELSRRRFFGLSIIMAGLTVAAIGLIHNLVLVAVLTFVSGVFAGIAWIIGFTTIEAESEGRRPVDFLHAAARVVFLGVVAVAALVGGFFGEHELAVNGLAYTFDGANLVLLVGAVAAVVIGVLSLRRLDDRPEVPLRVDLLAALRGERLAPEPPEEAPGMFIAFEGGEGSGKTTQSRLLAIWLRDQGFDVVQTREPGSTKVGMRLRAILLDSTHQGLSAHAETLLYAADRAEHVEKVIRPALERGSMVVCDRYVDSSLAYQGAGRVLGADEVAQVNQWATGGLVPHLTVLVDVPPSVGLRRHAHPADRIESEPLDFHERVRSEFRALAARDPERYFVVDGTLSQPEVSRLIQDRVREVLPDPVPRETEASTGTMPAIRD